MTLPSGSNLWKWPLEQNSQSVQGLGSTGIQYCELQPNKFGTIKVCVYFLVLLYIKNMLSEEESHASDIGKVVLFLYYSS